MSSIMSRIVPDLSTFNPDMGTGKLLKRTVSILKYSHNKPILDWSRNNRNGIHKSGWSIFTSLRPNICYRDEMKTKNRIWFVIEFPFRKSMFNYKNLIAIGYFFEVNRVTGLIDLFRFRFFVLSLVGFLHLL